MLDQSPLIQELLAEQTREDLVICLEARFGSVPADLSAALSSVTVNEHLRKLVRWAVQCPDLDAFRSRLPT